jgi:nucleoside-diphosphate-sugar epimerase
LIFILGGNGFVGSAFTRVLAGLERPFAVITRANYDSFVGKSCDIFINANGNSKKFVAANDPKQEFQASVASVRNSLVDFKFKKYVFLSTSDVYPDCSSPDLTREDSAIEIARQSPYGFHKYLAEQCVRHAAPDWLVIRQGGFVGPGLKKNAVFDIMNGGKLWVHRDSRFQFIHTEDSAKAVLFLAEAGIANEIVNVTATGTISVAEIMALAGRTVPSPEDAKPQVYEISTDKASRWLDLPTTRQCIAKFLTSGGA